MDFSISEGSWLVDTEGEWDYNTQHYGKLNSVTLWLYPMGYTAANMTTGFGIGIYEKREGSNGTTWIFVGKTDWFSHRADSYMGEHCFTLQDDVVLSTEKTYTMAFIAGCDYYDGLTPGKLRLSMDGATYWADSEVPEDTLLLAAVGLLREPQDPTGTVLLYGGGATGEVRDVTPYVFINVTPLESDDNVMVIDSVPEPATASLSLLALAALAARRRRN